MCSVQLSSIVITPCCQKSSGIYELETKALGGGVLRFEPYGGVLWRKGSGGDGLRKGDSLAAAPPNLKRFTGGVGRGVSFTLG